MTSMPLSQNFNPTNQLSSQYQTQSINTDSSQNVNMNVDIKIQQDENVATKTNTNTNDELSFYEQQIMKLSYMNSVITAQLASAIQQKRIVMNLIAAAEQQEQKQYEEQKQKRVRRLAKDIERKHQCPVKSCEKAYGTQASLSQHIKLKHPKINSHDPPLMLDPA